MIKRYTREKTENIFSKEYELNTMLNIEILACEAMNILGEVPNSALKNIKEKAKFDIKIIEEIEKTTNHDLIAFVTNIGEYVGDDSKYIHKGLTSSDIKDTALSVIMRDASDILIDGLNSLSEILKEKAKKYKHTVCIGRSHAVHAEPTTFGMKMLLWLDETERNISRLKNARETISVGKLSGAIGTYSNVNPFVEEYVCEKLGLKKEKISTQIIQRDRHAEYMATLAVIAGSFEKFATEIRNLARTEIREVEEYFSVGQKGSSAMPHKRNPINSERITGLSRVIRGNLMPALEDIALWHERDLTHSSVERIIVGDSVLLLDYIISKFSDVIKKLNVYEETMKKNIDKTGGLIFSQRILIALVEKGVLRDTAYLWVQRNAMEKWDLENDFKSNIKEDKDIKKYLNEKEMEDCFSVDYYLRNIDTIFKRFDL